MADEASRPPPESVVFIMNRTANLDDPPLGPDGLPPPVLRQTAEGQTTSGAGEKQSPLLSGLILSLSFTVVLFLMFYPVFADQLLIEGASRQLAFFLSLAVSIFVLVWMVKDANKLEHGPHTASRKVRQRPFTPENVQPDASGVPWQGLVESNEEGEAGEPSPVIALMNESTTDDPPLKPAGSRHYASSDNPVTRVFVSVYLMILMGFGLVLGPTILQAVAYAAYYGEDSFFFCQGICCVVGLLLSPLLLGLAPKTAKVQVDETR
tara:strand:- start:88 stop:882 length:795 start_codon:yes stop_codon:yes gene_type:complete